MKCNVCHFSHFFIKFTFVTCTFYLIFVLLSILPKFLLSEFVSILGNKYFFLKKSDSQSANQYLIHSTEKHQHGIFCVYLFIFVLIHFISLRRFVQPHSKMHIRNFIVIMKRTIYSVTILYTDLYVVIRWTKLKAGSRHFERTHKRRHSWIWCLQLSNKCANYRNDRFGLVVKIAF